MHERPSGQNTGRDTLRQDEIGQAAGMCRFFSRMLAGLYPAAPFGDCHILGTSTQATGESPMDIIIVGNYPDSAPYLDIKFLDFQCARCLCQLEKRDRSPNSRHLHCPNCSKNGIIERSTSLATECLRKGIQRDVSPTTLAKPCAEERRE